MINILQINIPNVHIKTNMIKLINLENSMNPQVQLFIDKKKIIFKSSQGKKLL